MGWFLRLGFYLKIVSNWPRIFGLNILENCKDLRATQLLPPSLWYNRDIFLPKTQILMLCL